MVKHIIFALLLSAGNLHGLLRIVAGSARSAATTKAWPPKPAQCGRYLIPKCLSVIGDLDSKKPVHPQRLREIFEGAQRFNGCFECSEVSRLVEGILRRLRIAREPDL